MSNNPSAGTISLPQGGGALSGIGEKFSPDLFTGTGNFTVPIALPPGRNGFQPQLHLVYSTGNGNGPFGLGWNLSIPGVSRKTSDGVPLYNEAAEKLRQGERRDVFILSGAEDLVPISGSYPGKIIYRPRTEGLFARITHHQVPNPDPLQLGDNHWQVESKDGLVSLYGTPKQLGNDPAALTKPGDAQRVFAWKLTETKDPFGNLIRYDYGRDCGEKDGRRWDQPLLKQIRYVDYGNPADDNFLVKVEFEYEYDERPDSFSDYRAGFEIRTTRLCRSIKVSTCTADGTTHNVREYQFVYQSDPNNGVSLLQQMDIIGYDETIGPHPKQLPPLTFGYTQFEPKERRFEVVDGRDLPARALGAPDMELVDLHGSGLPDILEMNGVVRYWRNLGNGRFDMPRPMRDAPPHALADPGVQMIDANGDGRMDLLVTSGPLAGYYPLTHSAAWDRKSFQRYSDAPSFNLDDPEVRLVDLDGDGYTDILRSGSRLECFFNDPDPLQAWHRTHFAPRQTLDAFPNVNFSDPRVKLADMTGDGLQDIVLIHDGNVEYWPNLGHGHWGRRISMRHGPRYRDVGYDLGYDPRRILLGDVDGDGLADIVYVGHDRVLLWLNHSGNAWSQEPIVIHGTPPVTDLDNLRLIDLHGTGVSGVLWSTDATGLSRHRLMFLDFTGGLKPYVLNEMDNHMGAVTRVEYRPSTYYYLEDQKKPNSRWRTPLPFPVQVVARVEVIDAVSQGKLTTEYKYHHGYWDGAEREFRGFGMVEQFDTETFTDYHAGGLHGDPGGFKPVLNKHFSLPTLTKTWFHQGPVGEEFGDWAESDYTGEYWQGDPQLLGHTEQVNGFLRDYNDRAGHTEASPRNRRIKRDALRALRGSILRSELYALDGDSRLVDGKKIQKRPYTVTEHSYNLEEIAPLATDNAGRSRIFFPHPVAQRTTQWERGDDPMTQFSFTDYRDRDRENKFDAFGRPHRQTAVAMPRLVQHQANITGAVVDTINPNETQVLATHARTFYTNDPSVGYIHDRVAQVKSYELANPPPGPDDRLDNLPLALRKQWAAAQQVRDRFNGLAVGDVHLIGHQLNHYDGPDFEGLAVGRLGPHGALTRTEALVFTDGLLNESYGDRRPDYLDGAATLPGNPTPGFGSDIGYRKTPAVSGSYEAGYYTDTQRQRLSPRGLALAMQDALKHETRIQYDAHDLLPVHVLDAANMETRADYNYRLLQPKSMTEPNGNSTRVIYNPIGLPLKQFVTGLDAEGNVTLGGTEAKPEISFEYNFLNFERNRKPLFVHTTRRIHHASDNLSDDTIETREYSDGYGRLIQTRAQAEEWVFGATGDDVGLPTLSGAGPSPAVAQRAADRVVVSGWQVFDNKGRVIEKYEPVFSQKFDFEPEAGARRVQHATMFYDPRGNVIRTLNPDGSQQRVILGRPRNPRDLQIDVGDLESSDAPDSFEPTPWETYTYDANDLAPISFHPTEKLPDDTPKPLTNHAPEPHHFTPASSVIDALGHVLCQVQRNGGEPANHWFVTHTEYDLRGNALKIVDALNRPAFKHSYDLLNRLLRVDSIDAGLRTSVLNAQGNLIEYRDSKGSLARRTYDKLNRPQELWARNDRDSAFTLRERIHYGDEGTHALARQHNTLCKPVKHNDEAGLLEMPEYDFKGNLLEKYRRTIRDDALANGWHAEWEKPNAEDALEAAAYQTSSRHDALNRPTEVTYPQDVDGERKKLIPRYNRAGALESVALDDADYVQHIAYNAKGQRVLIAYGNGVMTRHAYDPLTFRLARLRTDRQPGLLRRLVGFISGSPDTMTFESSPNPIQDFAYTYDLAGNITEIDEQVTNCGITDSIEGRNRLLREFNYDPIYRLTLATGRACKDIGVPRGLGDDPRCGFYAGGAATATQNNAPDLTERYTESFSYDPAGNMLKLHYDAPSGEWARRFGMSGFTPKQWQEKISAPPGGSPIDWGNEGNRLTNVGNEDQVRNHHFDANGNLIRQNTERRHTWDHADRMIGYVVKPAGGPASIEARYLYGADGMRVKKWVRNQQLHVNTTVYVDGAFEQHRQTDPTGTRENNTLHVMDNQSRIALVRIGAPLDERDASPQVQYHFGDHLGSSHVVLGGANATSDSFINREEYFPYGETSFGSFGKKRYRYSGKERDEESGLYYYGARYLAPWVGRWVSCDSILEPMQITEGRHMEHVSEPSNDIGSSTADINLYFFVFANPVVFVDPDGREPKWGQLGNLGAIENEVKSVDLRSGSDRREDLKANLEALAAHFEGNRFYRRDPTSGALSDTAESRNVKRYIYTKQEGWIDLHHFFVIAEKAREKGLVAALQTGGFGEAFQDVSGKQGSAYSYEDLTSNRLGAAFMVKYKGALESGKISIGEAVISYLRKLLPVEPDEAPNIDFIPHLIDPKFTLTHVSGKKALKGPELRKKHEEIFESRPKEQRDNIKDAHKQITD